MNYDCNQKSIYWLIDCTGRWHWTFQWFTKLFIFHARVTWTSKQKYSQQGAPTNDRGKIEARDKYAQWKRLLADYA